MYFLRIHLTVNLTDMKLICKKTSFVRPLLCCQIEAARELSRRVELPWGSRSTKSSLTSARENLTRFGSSNFSLRSYPAAVDGFATYLPNSVNSADSKLTTDNEQNVSVAVGWARPQSTLVSWLLIIEQSHDEAWSPIQRLRTIVLACVFGTIGFLLVVVLPMAHYSVRPIRRLRDATEKSIAPPGYTPNGSIRTDLDEREISGDEMGGLEHRNSNSQRSKKGLFMRLKHMTPGSRRKTIVERHEDERRRVFKIPGKVRDRKHFIKDELTELTSEFSLSLHSPHAD